MVKARRLVGKENNANLGLLILVALVFGSCVANCQYLGGRRSLRRGLAAASGTIIDITQCGAVPDGTTNTFKAFLNAWIKVCESTSPATLLVPKGEFLAGPVIFAGPCKSQVTVQVQGTILATTSGFATPEWFLFERVDNLVLTGTGTFDGKGEAVWKAGGCGKKVKCNLPPTSLKFRNMKNLEINGITSLNAKAFHMFLVKTENVNIQNIKLIAPAESPNTDGIHLSNADNISITNSTMATGDDCVSVGRGSNNVTVERVTCGPGHGLSVGSLGKYKAEEDVSGIFVRNCKMIGTDNGLRIKTWGGSDPSKCSNIQFENIVMENVKNPIIIDQNYGSRGGDSKVTISDVSFKGISGTTITKDIVQLTCSKSVPCTGINVADVNLNFVGKANEKSSSGGEIGALCQNANVVFGGKLSFPKCAGAGQASGGAQAGGGAQADGGAKAGSGGAKSDSGVQADGGAPVSSDAQANDGAKAGGGVKSDSGVQADGGTPVSSGAQADGGAKAGGGTKVNGGAQVDSGKQASGGEQTDNGKQVKGDKQASDDKPTSGGGLLGGLLG